MATLGLLSWSTDFYDEHWDSFGINLGKEWFFMCFQKITLVEKNAGWLWTGMGTEIRTLNYFLGVVEVSKAGMDIAAKTAGRLEGL